LFFWPSLTYKEFNTHKEINLMMVSSAVILPLLQLPLKSVCRNWSSASLTSHRHRGNIPQWPGHTHTHTNANNSRSLLRHWDICAFKANVKNSDIWNLLSTRV